MISYGYVFHDLCFLSSLTGDIVSLHTHNVEIKGQCQIVIHKVADKFSQEHYVWQWLVSSGSQHKYAGHTYIMQLICRYTASPTPESYSALVEWLMLHALWNQIYQRCSAQAFAVPSRLVKLHCANVEFSCFANRTQICGYIGMLHKILQKIQSLNIKVLTIFISLIIGLPRIWVSWGMVCIPLKFENKYFCMENNYFFPNLLKYQINLTF